LQGIQIIENTGHHFNLAVGGRLVKNREYSAVWSIINLR
jgi:hypothetical protein